MDEQCRVCGNKIEIMAFKNTGLCCENCKLREDSAR